MKISIKSNLRNNHQNLIIKSNTSAYTRSPQIKRTNFQNSVLVRLLGLSLLVSILSFSSAVQASRRGSSGVAVKQLQNSLIKQGYYDGPVTGYYGELTEDAVRKFQAAEGLKVDGIAGLSTVQELWQDNKTKVYPGMLERGSRGRDIVDLQYLLSTANYYNGPFTGYYGQLTENAVRKFQSSKDLQVDGIVGPRTWSLLISTASEVANK